MNYKEEGITDICLDSGNDYQSVGYPSRCLNTMPISADEYIFDTSDTRNCILVRGLKPKRRLILNCKQAYSNGSWVQELFLKRSQGFGKWIPKQVVSVEERYLWRCLELIHISATDSVVPCGLLNLDSLDAVLTAERFGYCETMRSNSSDLAKFVIECPVAADTGDVASPVGQGIVGSITRSNSMIKILNSPLFQQLGKTRRSSNDQKLLQADPMRSPGASTITSSYSYVKEKQGHSVEGYKSNAVQRNPLSISGACPVLSDESSYRKSLAPADCQGILKCSWNRGLWHFELSVDDQKELYVANASKVDLPTDRALDCIYSFYAKPYGLKESEYMGVEPDNVMGKMKVSTSFSLSADSSQITETEFVLFGMNEKYGSEMQISHCNYKKTRKLSKVLEVFKNGPSSKHRSPSHVRTTSYALDHCPLEITEETCSAVDPMNIASVSESQFLPNLELAAIVVRNHVTDTKNKEKEVDGGGWGLKFLKKKRAGAEQMPAPSLGSMHSEHCQRSIGDCSTSTEIVIPAGIHGGPRTRQGGPSGLIERWRSGGHCDCGGWDMGCPLTVLKSSPRNDEGLSHPEVHGQCKSFDICTEGSFRQGTPTMKMVNIRDGLYFLNFKPTLSVLQCFSIAVAIYHSQSPTLVPKNVQD